MMINLFESAVLYIRDYFSNNPNVSVYAGVSCKAEIIIVGNVEKIELSLDRFYRLKHGRFSESFLNIETFICSAIMLTEQNVRKG